MTNEVRCWCRHCKAELPPDHTVPCPKCGKSGKDCKVSAIAAIGLAVSYSAKKTHEYTKKHPLFIAISILITIAALIVGYLLGGLVGLLIGIILAILNWWLAPYAREIIKEITILGERQQEPKQPKDTKGKIKKMNINRPTLIELYKTTLEELRHHDRVYWQALLGFALISSVYLAAISFLLGEDSPVRREYLLTVKVGIFSLIIPLTILFALSISRIGIRLKISVGVIRRIEGRLRAVENTGQGFELDGLLVREELDKAKFDSWFGRKRFWFYIPIGVLAFIALWLFLFIALEK